ncbi:MAG TPA: DUF1428 domain-containing protein [Chthoniobacterales bacterium]|jgi:uncharacterized protein YbaA (DUF1428 family)|nr:DUF1428 domain-containing protein [Chthoniobacterales bacterium]
MSYVDGYVLPVPKKNLAAYRRMASHAGKIWREHGALEFRECVGDDLNSKMARSFSSVVKPRPGETIVFSWIVYKSKAQRNSVNKKVMTDPRLEKMMKGDSPFDPRRMIYGGFKVMVEA